MRARRADATAHTADGIRRPRVAAVAVAILLCALSSTPDCALAQAPGGGTAPRLRVLVTEDPPFVVRQGTRWSGWAVDLWTEVAQQAGFDWDIVGQASPNAVVDALAAGKADIGVGDISVTKERDKVIDFSHPFYRSGLRIMVRAKHQSFFGALAQLATPVHLRLLLGMIGLLAAMSALVYVLARRHDSGNFPTARAEAIVEAVYVASGALLKGQLDRKLLPGIFARVLTIVWMFLGAGVVAYVTASVAAVLTVQQLSTEIHDVADLAGRPVAALSGTFTVRWLADRSVDVREQPTLEAAAQALLAGRVDAVVHDAPVLGWWVAQHPGAPVQLTGRVFERNDYAFAIAEQSPLRVQINPALLDLQEDGFFNELDRRWLDASH